MYDICDGDNDEHLIIVYFSSHCDTFLYFLLRKIKVKIKIKNSVVEGLKFGQLFLHLKIDLCRYFCRLSIQTIFSGNALVNNY